MRYCLENECTVIELKQIRSDHELVEQMRDLHQEIDHLASQSALCATGHCCHGTRHAPVRNHAVFERQSLGFSSAAVPDILKSLLSESFRLVI